MSSTLGAVSSWLDLVFHVLAHVEATASCPASVFDRAYVAFAAAHLGPADARALGDDLAPIATAVRTHDALVRAQLVAWLFEDVAHAVALADRDLRDLAPAEVARPSLLAVVLEDEAGAELVRAAALLEVEAWSRLPAPEDTGALQSALEHVLAAAPALARCEVRSVRALRLRGRVLRDGECARIWVGLPGDAPPLDAGHAAWQAAHEATVDELSEHARAARLAVEHASLEHAALVLLAVRAERGQLRDAHRAWLSHLVDAPPIDRASLRSPWRALVDARLE
jgi:hypothetical protein